jgi:hypothetical protein
LNVRRFLLYTLFVSFLSSFLGNWYAQNTYNTTLKNTIVHSIPPTFITLSPVKSCNPMGSFPQRNPLPYWKYATQTQYTCDVYEKDNIAWSLLIFYELWEAEFGDIGGKVKNALQQLQITWGAESRVVINVYSIQGEFLETAEVTGLVESRHSIWVAAAADISDTALIHELVHISLIHSCGSADADHEGDEYPCWSPYHSMFIDHVNLILSTKYRL